MAPAGDSEDGAALRRRVLALVRASRPAARARRSCLSVVFARFSAACRALAASASAVQSGGDAQSSDWFVADERRVWAELERLDAHVTRADSVATLELPRLVAQCLTTDPTLPRVTEREPERRASLKRSRSDWTPPPRQEDEDSNALLLWVSSLPTSLSHALSNLLVVWVLHHTALVRLDALLVAAVGNASGLCDAVRLVLNACPVTLPGSWRRLLHLSHGLRRPSQGSSSGSDAPGCDSHALVACIVAQLVQVAFTNDADVALGFQDVELQRVPARAAVSMLEALCASSPSLPLAQQIPYLCAVIDALPSSRQPVLQVVQGSWEPIVKSRDTDEASEIGLSESTAFLSAVLYAFLCRAASESRVHDDECSRVIDSVIRVLPSSASIQVVRRFLTHDADANDLSLSTSGNPSANRSVRGAVLHLVKRCSSVDAEFASLALTLAHELAEDAVLRGKTWLLGHALELVATVSLSPLANLSCYKDWFQAHCGSGTSDNPVDLKAGDDVLRCLKASKRGASETCRLIHNKNHLQLMCLFLVEFDRRGNGNGAGVGEATSDHVVWTSTHVMTHLSVLKSFQGQQSPENALVIDFCAQARICYTTLLAREQAGREPSSTKGSLSTLADATSAPTSASKRQSLYSSEARAVVDENVAYYKQHRSLSPQLKTWKTFQYLKWKSDILPCCLDVAIDENWAALDASDASSDRRSDVVDQVHFVFALAKANMVPADDYARFLGKIQSWVDRTRLSIAQDMRRRRQRDVASSLRRSVKRLRSIGQRSTIVAPESREALISECLASISESIFAYLDSHAAYVEADNAAYDQSRQERMLLLWKTAFVEVLAALGIGGLDEFYHFQVSLLVKFSEAAARRSTTSFLGELSSIALTHRPSAGNDVNSRRVVEWMACFAGVVSGMIVTSKHQHASVISADALREFSIAEIDTSARKQEPLVGKTLLYTCFLQALALAQTTNPEMDVFFASTHAFPTNTVDFWAWMAYRAWRDERWVSSIETVVSFKAAGSCDQDRWHAMDWIRQVQRCLLGTKWLRTFQERWGLVETAKSMLGYEFRYGSVLRGALSSPLPAGDADWTPTSTLQRHLEIVDATGANQTPEYWCQWLIDEILCLAAAQSHEHSSEQALSSDSSAEAGLQAALLLLNDLVHRALQSPGAVGDVRNDLMSQWLSLSVQKLSASGEQSDTSKRMLYRCSSEILLVLRGLNDRASQLPRLHSVDDKLVIELLRYAARDLGQPHVSASVRRFLLLPLLELVKQQHLEREWSMESLMDVPIVLLVEWGLLLANRVHKPRHETSSSNGHNVELHNWRLLALIEWLGLTITTMVTAGTKVASARPQSTLCLIGGRAGSCTSVSSIFSTASEGLKFLVQATRFVLESSGKMHCGSGQPGIATRLDRMAEVAIDACSGGNWNAAPSVHQQLPSSNGIPKDDGEAAHTLVPWLFVRWREHVAGAHRQGDPLQYQLFLLQFTAALCTRTAHASKRLFESSAGDEALRAVFIVLVASVASDSGQLSAIMTRTSSLWVNSFPEAALVANTRSSTAHKSMKRSPEDTPVFEESLGSTSAFRQRVSTLVNAVLTYGVDHQIDLLTASLKPRIVAQWPHLKALTARLPVLSLDDDMAL